MAGGLSLSEPNLGLPDLFVSVRVVPVRLGVARYPALEDVDGEDGLADETCVVGEEQGEGDAAGKRLIRKWASREAK